MGEENEERIERAKSLPYFIRNNAEIINKISLLKLDINNNVSSTRLTDAPILSAKIEANRREYERLVADPITQMLNLILKMEHSKQYTKGTLRIHQKKEQMFFWGENLTSTDLELLCQDILLNETKLGPNKT